MILNKGLKTKSIHFRIGRVAILFVVYESQFMNIYMYYLQENISNWICKNVAKDLHPHHPYFTMISLNFWAASKPCKRAKNRERMAMKAR